MKKQPPESVGHRKHDENGDPRAKLGLALGGGSVLGFAHVGVLAALEEAGIKPDAIAGTSAGAGVGAMYAFGKTPSELRTILGKLRWRKASAFTLTGMGLLSNDPLGDLVRRTIGDVRIENAPIDLAIVATDINTGERIILREGSVTQAVRASTCVPGLYVPVQIEGHLLVDGGLVENVPVSPLQQQNVRCVVAVNLRKDSGYRQVTSIGHVLTNAIQIAIDKGFRSELRRRADVLIEPDLSKFSAWVVADLPEIYERGYEAGKAAADEIHAVIAGMDS